MNHSWMSAIIRSENSVEKMQVFWPWSSLRMSACTVPRTDRSTSSRDRPRMAPWSMAVLRKKARMVGAGPLIVIDTEVVGADRSNPSYSAFMSSRVAIDTPEVPTLPYTSGRSSGSRPYKVTESNAVDSRVALGQQLEPPVGPERVTLPGEHPGRVLPLALEREHPGGEGETPGQVLLAQEPQQLAVVGEPGQRHPRHLVTGQRLAGQLGVQLAVPDGDHLLVARVRLDGGGPLLQQPLAVPVEAFAGLGGQVSHALLAVPRQLGRDLGEALHPAGRPHLPGGLLVVTADGGRDVAQVVDPFRRDDRGRVGGGAAGRGGQDTLAERQPLLLEQAGQVLVERGHAVVVEGGGAGPEPRHVLRPGG